MVVEVVEVNVSAAVAAAAAAAAVEEGSTVQRCASIHDLADGSPADEEPDILSACAALSCSFNSLIACNSFFIFMRRF